MCQRQLRSPPGASCLVLGVSSMEGGKFGKGNSEEEEPSLADDSLGTIKIKALAAHRVGDTAQPRGDRGTARAGIPGAFPGISCREKPPGDIPGAAEPPWAGFVSPEPWKRSPLWPQLPSHGAGSGRGPPRALGGPTGRDPPCATRDLMELMLIQTSQMHQLLMHSLAMAALMPLSAGPAPAPAQALEEPSKGEEEEEAMVFHHHYIPWPAPRPAPVRFLRSSPGGRR
ncbi:proline-rich protein 29 [Haemorhous mexicanus]|uniref:proline-rich protein 29 n=1 Tax=Haemorhous mexicanus TaxID=30427 RepID=UPI0028BE1B35|nr:proline-rich protein 29 [Haemorhous mexicanus]